MKNCKPLIKLLSEEEFIKLSPEKQVLYLRLYREQVSPKFEEWRNPHPIKVAYGGRGAGAKSISSAKLLLEFAEYESYFGKSIRVLCVRNVQKSIKESSWQTLKDCLSNLHYKGWSVTNDKIENLKNGSYFTFSGLNDLSADNLKSLSNYDIMYAEEAAPISKDSWLKIEPTFRKKNSEMWMIFNRELPHDPVYELYCENPDPSWSVIECAAGGLDNPWFPKKLQRQWDRLKKTDPEEALHVFGGKPRAQNKNSVWSLLAVNSMIDRELTEDDTSGDIEIGCDVARFGKDCTVAFKRRGFKVLEMRVVHGFDTIAVAGMLWEMAEHSESTLIKVDVGYNPGVIDVLYEYGANVMPVGFGETAINRDVYANAATEMMFDLPVNKISVPADIYSRELEENLTERLFGYDLQGRKKIESKDSSNSTNLDSHKETGCYKARHGGKSPDYGDAFCLCFYEIRGAVCY